MAVDNEWRTIDLDRGDDGMRVDRVLLRHLRREKSVSRNRIQKWIEAGQVLVNGVVPPRAAWRVQPGDELRVRVAEIPARAKPQAQAIELDILYEDDDLLAVNKPAGLVVHPSFGNLSGTLMNGLLDRARLWPSGSKPALLGRLDKLTSGIVLVTKRTEIYTALQRDHGREAHRQGLPRHRSRQAVPAARHHQPGTRSRPVGSPSHYRYRSWRTTVGDALRAPVDGQRLFARSMPPHHRPHASDPRAPCGKTVADRRRRDLRIESGTRPGSTSSTRFRGRRCIRGGWHFANREPGATSRLKRRCRRTWPRSRPR